MGGRGNVQSAGHIVSFHFYEEDSIMSESLPESRVDSQYHVVCLSVT